MSAHISQMEDRLIQPIVLLVDKANPAPHLEAIATVARASVTAYAEDLNRGRAEDWAPWLEQSYAKTVRRADSKSLSRMALLPGGARIESLATSAIAFRPTHYSRMDKGLLKLQVSGTELPRVSVSSTAEHQIVLNSSLGMSTGKSAAQAAHALMGWFLTLTADQQAVQFSEGFPVNVIEVAVDEFAELSAHALAPIIVDSGFTEIAPKSPTAFVIRSKP